MRGGFRVLDRATKLRIAFASAAPAGAVRGYILAVCR